MTATPSSAYAAAAARVVAVVALVSAPPVAMLAAVLRWGAGNTLAGAFWIALAATLLWGVADTHHRRARHEFDPMAEASS